MKEFDVVSLPRCPHHEGDLKTKFRFSQMAIYIDTS